MPEELKLSFNSAYNLYYNKDFIRTCENITDFYKGVSNNELHYFEIKKAVSMYIAKELGRSRQLTFDQVELTYNPLRKIDCYDLIIKLDNIYNYVTDVTVTVRYCPVGDFEDFSNWMDFIREYWNVGFQSWDFDNETFHCSISNELNRNAYEADDGTHASYFISNKDSNDWYKFDFSVTYHPINHTPTYTYETKLNMNDYGYKQFNKEQRKKDRERQSITAKIWSLIRWHLG